MLAVAAEQLVGALAGERDGHVVGGQLAEREEADRGEVRERLVEVPDQAPQVLGVALQLDLELVVVGAQRLGHATGVGDLGVLACEADREGLERLGHVARHQRDDQARVEAAAEHRAERHVAHQPHLHRLVELVEHDLGPLVGRARVAVGVRHRVVPPALEPHAAVLDDQALARQQLADALQRRHGARDVAEHQVGGDRLGVELGAHEPAGEDAP